MNVLQLKLRNFRNLELTEFRPHPRINFLVGKNGQGKTSVLEALSYLSVLRSFRGAKLEEIIFNGTSNAEISSWIAPEKNPEYQSELKISFTTTLGRTKKTAFINGKAYPSSTQYLSQRFGSVELGFHAISFNPSDHDLVRGDPAGRRTYLDRVLSAEDANYLPLVQRYARLIEQRNALLKMTPAPSRSLLEGFTSPLAQLAAQIAYRRLIWISRLYRLLPPIASKVAPNQPRLRFFYLSSWVPQNSGLSIANSDLESAHFTGLPEVPSIEILEQAFWNKLNSVLLNGAELRARSTLVGPHRDDWGFAFGDRWLKGHGSQGEVRTALLALKLSEIELFRDQTGHRPLLLMDDFSSELDHQRREFLLNYLAESDLQVFITTTELSHYFDRLDPSNGKQFEVHQGKVFEP